MPSNHVGAGTFGKWALVLVIATVLAWPVMKWPSLAVLGLCLYIGLAVANGIDSQG